MDSESNVSIMSVSHSKRLGDRMGRSMSVESVSGTDFSLACLILYYLFRVRLRMYIFRSFNNKKGLGLLIGAKFNPRLRREVSAVKRTCDDKFKYFHSLLDFWTFGFGPGSPSSTTSPVNFLFLEVVGGGLCTKKDMSIGRGCIVLFNFGILTSGEVGAKVACLADVEKSSMSTKGGWVLS